MVISNCGLFVHTKDEEILNFFLTLMVEIEEIIVLTV